MAAEPINIFSHKIDPRGVLAVLRRVGPMVNVEGPTNNWTQARVTLPRKGLFGKPRTILFRHDREYYDGRDWPRRRTGMQGYFSRFPLGDVMPRVMQTIASFRFCLSVQFDPERMGDDERMRCVVEVARHLDGCVFTPSALLDAFGRTLAAADGESDPEATWPTLPPTEDHPAAAAEPPPVEAGDEDLDEPVPPSANRVALRALALGAVSARALLEQEDPGDPGVEQTRQRLIHWVKNVGLGDELEPEESKVLQRPLNRLEHQDTVNATWRLEGLAVLAWALNWFELPPHDQVASPGELLPAVGILNVDRAKALVAEPALRSNQIARMRHRLLAIHWRLVNFRLKPEAMDFAEFARTAWFGPLDITDCRLIDNDLAIGDKPIASADPQIVRATASIATERHLAINWLSGYSRIYSKTDVST